MNEDKQVFDYTQSIPDRFNPFNNDTENTSYRDDYRKIVPQISVSGCVIPQTPSKFEKNNIKSVYNRTAFTLVIHFILSNIFAVVIMAIVSLFASRTVGVTNLENFMSNSSVYMDVVAITYTISNILAFLIGCKFLHLPIANVFNKPTVNTKSMLKHISIAWCLQGLCMIIVSIIYTIASSTGVDLIPDSVLTDANYNSITYCIATFLYSCIIAPITEEMLFRGVVLRGFSVVSQRFGIFMSALLFGLLHGNILQFVTTFTVGIYLAFVATKYNSILPTIVIHFFINLIPTIMEIALCSNEEVYNLAMYSFYGIMIILGLVLICIGHRFKANRLPIQNAHQKKRTLPLALSSIGVLTILVLYLGTLISNHLL